MNKPRGNPKDFCVIDDKPAFPCVRLENHKGMSMRQWYKGMALNSFRQFARGKYDQKEIGHICGLIADALLREDEEHEDNK